MFGSTRQGWFGVLLASAAVCGMSDCPAATVSVDPAWITAGFAQIELAVLLSSGTGEDVAALQFDLLFDENELSLEEVLVGEAAQAAGKNASANRISPGQLRVVISGFNLNLIGNGPVAVIPVELLPDVPVGASVITLSNVVLSDPGGASVPASVNPSQATIEIPMLPTGLSNPGPLLALCLLLTCVAVAAMRGRAEQAPGMTYGMPPGQ